MGASAISARTPCRPPRPEAAVNRAAPRAGTRLAWLAAGLALLSAACAGRAEEKDPIVARVEMATRDEKAQRAMAALLSSCGGYEVWQGMGEAEYRYRFQFFGGDPQPRLVRLQKHWLSLDDEVHVRLQDLEGADPIEVRLDLDKVALLRGGQPFDDPSQSEFQRAFGRQVRWEFLTPWTFLQPGVLLESRGVPTPPTAGKVPPGPCDVIRVRFERPMEGGGTDDWHDVYISGRSHLVEEIVSYRSSANQYRLSVWSDHRDFDGLRVATRRETYASDEAATVGPLQAVSEYSDVRFIRRDAAEPAPSAAR